MANYHLELLKLADKFIHKYALDASTIKDEVKNAVQTAIGNASTHSTLGIMPFVKMLDQDQATLAINVTRNGNNVTVSNPTVDPPDLTLKYIALPSQIKTYLERYIEVYPMKRNGELIDYDNFTVTLEYGGNQNVARQ